MQLTTKTEYAIRALIELAQRSGEKPMAIREICQKQNLPVKYTEQLFRKLKHHEIIKSIKGSLGGYILASPPEAITLKEIMIAVEEGFGGPICSGKHGSREFCSGEPCSFLNMWEKITTDMDGYFTRIRLSSFLTHTSGKTYYFNDCNSDDNLLAARRDND